MMTPEEFKKEMLEISKIGDEEAQHEIADDLMCEILKELRYEEGVEIFKEMDKWYA